VVAQGFSTWLREIRKLTTLYLISAIAFSPWGIAYELLKPRWPHPSVLVLFLGGGLVTALLVWRIVEAKVFVNRTPVAAMNTSAQIVFTYDVAVLPVDVVFDNSWNSNVVLRGDPLQPPPFITTFEPVARSTPAKAEMIFLVTAEAA
jgi:hypothetical protein